MGMDSGLTTLEDEIAENSGADWEETLDQRAVEVGRFKKLGLRPPEWAGVDAPASRVSKPPPKPDAT